MERNDCLVFRPKLSKADVQGILIRYLQLEGIINGNEEKYFTEMTQKGKSFQFEFCVPLSDIKEKDEQ